MSLRSNLQQNRYNSYGYIGDTYVGAKLDKSLGSNDLEGWGLHLEKVKNIFIVVQDCLPL